MHSVWHWLLFFSHSSTSVYMSNSVSSADTDFVLVIFLQWGIEEAQLGLQHRDEAIHQVGTEMSVVGSDSPKRLS